MYHEERKLPVKITDEERAELEKRNATIDIQLIVAKEDLEMAKAIHKEKTKGILEEKKNNLQTHRNGYEMRLVKAAEYFNEDQATVEYIDEEGTQIHVRAMTIEERRQYKIPFNRKKEAGV